MGTVLFSGLSAFDRIVYGMREWRMIIIDNIVMNFYHICRIIVLILFFGTFGYLIYKTDKHAKAYLDKHKGVTYEGETEAEIICYETNSVRYRRWSFPFIPQYHYDFIYTYKLKYNVDGKEYTRNLFARNAANTECLVFDNTEMYSYIEDDKDIDIREIGYKKQLGGVGEKVMIEYDLKNPEYYRLKGSNEIREKRHKKFTKLFITAISLFAIIYVGILIVVVTKLK